MTDPRSSTRRDFMKTSGAAAGAFAAMGAVPAVHASGKQLLKVGLIGCGGRGKGAIENICEAAGTTYPIKIHALADVFEDRLKDCRRNSEHSEVCKDKLDLADERCFVGFDAYQKVIDCCDLVMLATPPGFRPQHIEAVVKAGKHLFTEKPVAVDPVGIRKVLAAYEEAKSKNLGILTGTQRRHQLPYLESMKRIKDGVIGDITSACVYWNQNNIWANKRQDGWNDMEYQLRNWYHYLWLCGDHICEQHVHNLDVAVWAIGAPPVRAVGMGGRQVNTAPEFGQSYDHFAVDYEFPNGIHVLSMCRQIDGCENNVSEFLQGTKGQWRSNGYRFSGNGIRERIREEGKNPYVQEHIDLLASIEAGKPLNELKQVAESTLVAIMGRMSAYTGKAVTWDEALSSQLDTFPKKLEWGSMPEIEVPTPANSQMV